MNSIVRSYIGIIVLVSFILIPSFALAQTPLPCGQVYAGVTNTPEQEDYYTFTASEGDTVRIVAARTSGDFNPAMVLYDPLGQEIASASAGGYSFSTAVAMEQALAATGE